MDRQRRRQQQRRRCVERTEVWAIAAAAVEIAVRPIPVVGLAAAVAVVVGRVATGTAAAVGSSRPSRSATGGRSPFRALERDGRTDSMLKEGRGEEEKRATGRRSRTRR